MGRSILLLIWEWYLSSHLTHGKKVINSPTNILLMNHDYILFLFFFLYFFFFLQFCCMFAHLDSTKISVLSIHRENGLGPTLWPCEFSEGGQGDEGVGHWVRGVQNTGDIVGLTGLYTAKVVRALMPRHSKGENKHTHPQKRKHKNTHMASDL